MAKGSAHYKHFCTYCLYSGKGMMSTCAKCANPTVQISHKFHLPSPSASKTRWKEFFQKSAFLQTGYMNEPAHQERIFKTLAKK